MTERPSRQDLVVPPQQSNMLLVVGSIACACAGFGLVWGIGAGRSARPDGQPPSIDAFSAAAAIAIEQASEPPQPVEPQADAPRYASADPEPSGFGAEQPIAVTEEGWRTTDTPQGQPSDGGRYPNRPVSLNAPESSDAADAQPPGLSRFSGPDPATTDRPASDPEAAATIPPAAAAQAGQAEPLADAPAAILESPAAEPAPGSEAAAAAIGGQGQPTAPGSGDALEASGPANDAAVADTDTVAKETVPIQSTPPAPETAPRQLPEDVGDLATLQPAGLPGGEDDPPTALPVASTTAIPSNPLRNAAATMPFAAAPPIVPPAADAVPTPPLTSTAGGGTTGQGRPGPLQLEGVQTPQITVEKRGPREVQVGKPARYEILVRNVGSAAAHDVMLRDSVPYGTSLVATTPPASPATAPAGSGPTGDIVWSLGSLPPGGQARVAMEVMPTVEGDVGSVASVTFRADASVRSRATKPDLRLEVATPKPVLIGKDLQFAISISNPGSGIATGVVVEGLLPEGVTHKSGRELEFDVGQLKPGESRTIDLTLATTGPGVHAARLTARADGRIEVEQTVRLEITAPTLELSVEIPSRRYLQRPATCILAMTNAGTAPAKGVELAAQLPPGMKFVRANNSGYYEERTHRVLWNLEELPPAEVGTVEMVVMPIALGPQKIVAAARTADGLSDQVAHTIDVDGLAALAFDVADSEDPIEIAGVTEYVVRIGNQGTKAASGVRLTATLLGDLELVEAKGPAAHRMDNLTVSFEPLARLAPSGEAIFRIRVRGLREGDQRVQVQLTSDDHPAPITKEEITRVYADQ
jgi:uncharacterized repeat protein (TIGR01451 family)